MGVISKPTTSSTEGEWSIKGAVEEILKRCDTYISSRTTIVLDEKIRQKISGATSKMSEMGLRVIAFAYGRGDSEAQAKGLTFAGTHEIGKTNW
jgi:P-type Ca2+ transporter type 2C